MKLYEANQRAARYEPGVGRKALNWRFQLEFQMFGFILVCKQLAKPGFGLAGRNNLLEKKLVEYANKPANLAVLR